MEYLLLQPHFIQLAKVWHSLLSDLNAISEVNRLNENFFEINVIEDSFMCRIEEEIIKNKDNQFKKYESKELSKLDLTYLGNQCQLIKHINNPMVNILQYKN